MKEQIVRAWRKMCYGAVMSCLIERTRQGLVKWDKDDDKALYVTIDGNIKFILSSSYIVYDYELHGIDINSNEKVFYQARGTKTLYDIIYSTRMAPINAHREERMNKYLQENC